MNLLKDRVRFLRVCSLIVLDIAQINAAVFFSLLLRFEFSLSSLAETSFVQNYLVIAPAYTLVTLVSFAIFRLYQSLWAFAGIDELRNICIAVFCSSLVLWPLAVAFGVLLPRSLPIMNMLVLTTMMVVSRYTYRTLRYLRNRPLAAQEATMLIGAGAAGSLILRELKTSEQLNSHVVCIIDDDSAKHGSYLMGVRVVGGREMIAQCAEKYKVKTIIIAIPTASAKDRRDLVNLCQATGCRIRIMPGLYQMVSGQVSVQQLRDVEVEDLLGREKVVVDQSEIGTVLQDKVILITGGGGSIGSELCRQVAGYGIRRLVIFDIYENNAYDIQQELRRTHPELDLVVCIGSVRDEARVDAVFRQYRPHVVCHAAAHKHVPLMEDSPAEAIKNNVFGTYNVAHAADRFGAESFILVSTDKAVNPTNIMGASKRICEMIVQTLGKTSKTKFAAVRFGNVLGSNGSVIPLFKKQIAAGGPITVTHKDIIRYFMTISEAVSLILQACVYAHGGQVFVLDMGEPVRIDDLARKMIRLTGLEPDVDIAIQYTGLRPGEKLFEELLMQDEGLETTPNQLIFIGQFNDFDEAQLCSFLASLGQACRENPESVKQLVADFVPTYHPAPEPVPEKL